MKHARHITLIALLALLLVACNNPRNQLLNTQPTGDWDQARWDAATWE